MKLANTDSFNDPVYSQEITELIIHASKYAIEFQLDSIQPIMLIYTLFKDRTSSAFQDRITNLDIKHIIEKLTIQLDKERKDIQNVPLTVELSNTSALIIRQARSYAVLEQSRFVHLNHLLRVLFDTPTIHSVLSAFILLIDNAIIGLKGLASQNNLSETSPFSFSSDCDVVYSRAIERFISDRCQVIVPIFMLYAICDYKPTSSSFVQLFYQKLDTIQAACDRIITDNYTGKMIQTLYPGEILFTDWGEMLERADIFRESLGVSQFEIDHFVVGLNKDVQAADLLKQYGCEYDGRLQ